MQENETIVRIISTHIKIIIQQTAEKIPNIPKNMKISPRIKMKTENNPQLKISHNIKIENIKQIQINNIISGIHINGLNKMQEHKIIMESNVNKINPHINNNTKIPNNKIPIIIHIQIKIKAEKQLQIKSNVKQHAVIIQVMNKAHIPNSQINNTEKQGIDAKQMSRIKLKIK